MKNKGKVIGFERTGKFYCKMGLKLLNSQKFTEASNYLKKAISAEPENCEYYFNLSGVYAEMGNVKESINVLEYVVKNLKNVMTECYFAMACNYFDLGEYKKSRKSFEKYSEIEPNGEFIVESLEAIKFIDTNILNKNNEKRVNIEKLILKGKELLDKFEFSKAIKVLEKVIHMAPELTIPRNNLSLAYYLQGDAGSAIDTARGVLKIDRYNPYANSNLALFYKTIDNDDFYRKQVESIKDSNFNELEEILNTVDILSKLNENRIIKCILERLTKVQDEIILWHFLAIAYHNSGQFNKAIDMWNFIRCKLPHMSIFTDCFIIESMKYIEDSSNFNTVNYDVKVFIDYIIRIEELIEVLMNMEQKEFNKIWGNNSHARDIINYFLYRLENKKKLKLIDKLANVGDENSIHMLNTYVFNSERKDEVSDKCAQIVMRSKVAGDANINIVELSSKIKERSKY